MSYFEPACGRQARKKQSYYLCHCDFSTLRYKNYWMSLQFIKI